jgi:hypothetical protein
MIMCLVAISSSASVFAQMVEIPLRHNGDLVRTTYEHITSAATVEDGKVLFSELPPTMKADLWVYQYHLYLTTMPELSVEQRAVIFESLGLVLAGIFDNNKTDPKWSAWAAQAKAKVQADAAAVFDRPTIKLIFMRLGNPATTTVVRNSGPGLHIKPDDVLYDCDCNSDPDQDFCCIWPTCTDVCRTGLGSRCIYTPDGCGWGWSQPCNGLCD